MAQVIGIGGIFVRARDADALRAWYRDLLGFDIQDWGGALWTRPAPGHEVWTAFRAETTYFAPSTRDFMVNLRVDDLDGMLARLRAGGAQVLDRREDGPEGKFGYVLDPEGTLLELWEPGG